VSAGGTHTSSCPCRVPSQTAVSTSEGGEQRTCVCLQGAEAWKALGVALTAALLANVSIVGLNQCYDIEIDRINKPYLPLASGEWSLGTGQAVVGVTGVAALLLAAIFGTPSLLATVAGSLVLGFAYSVKLPFFRWKGNPFAAAGCIIAVRAVFVQVLPHHPATSNTVTCIASSCIKVSDSAHAGSYSACRLAI
jgi:4-hydroxybenzoate polyprenyltransferase